VEVNNGCRVLNKKPMKTMTKQLGATVFILLTSLLLLLLSSKKLPLIDTRTDQYFKGTVTDATLAYATTRGVNAVVSVIKESELAISPAGIGFTIAVGQVLDPIDDMTERLSSVLVVSIVSLGLQKIINDVGGLISFQIVAFLLPFFIIPIWLNNRAVRLAASLIGRIITLAAILRLLLPISCFINDTMYQQVFSDQITEAREKLRVISSNYSELSSFNQPQQKGNLVSKFAQSTNRKVEKTREIFTTIINNAESIITSLVQLTILYVTLFITQVILIPVFMLWLLIKVIDTILLTGLLRKFTTFMEDSIMQPDQPKPEQIINK